jgi:ribonuclease P protein component
LTLPRENRLLHTNEIKEVFAKGKRKRGSLLSIYYMPLENGEYKMAVIIRKQKRATERNRMRRLIKEAYRLLLPRFRRGHHIVVMPLPSAIERLKKAKMQEVKEEMERILHKSGIL